MRLCSQGVAWRRPVGVQYSGRLGDMLQKEVIKACYEGAKWVVHVQKICKSNMT